MPLWVSIGSLRFLSPSAVDETNSVPSYLNIFDIIIPLFFLHSSGAALWRQHRLTQANLIKYNPLSAYQSSW
jgi:hypothetical protein